MNLEEGEIVEKFQIILPLATNLKYKIRKYEHLVTPAD